MLWPWWAVIAKVSAKIHVGMVQCRENPTVAARALAKAYRAGVLLAS